MKKIMFSDKYGLTKAVLNSQKTMTRRAISSKVWSKYCEYERGYQQARQFLIGGLMDCDEYLISLATFKVGEVVAIAQRYCDFLHCADVPKGEEKGWGNKMFVNADLMPHAIEITNIKVERLQDISDEDCLKEGIIKREDLINCQMENIVRYTFEGSFENSIWKTYDTPRGAFAALVDKVSGKGTWERNPYCFCYEFKLVK